MQRFWQWHKTCRDAAQSTAFRNTSTHCFCFSNLLKSIQGASVVLKNHSRSYSLALVLILAAGSSLMAAPRLGLEKLALSISSATGSNGPAQSVDAANLGDGSLQLQVASSVSWLTASLGQPHSCSLKGTCIPVQIAVPSASLAKGTLHGNGHGIGPERGGCAAIHHRHAARWRSRARQPGVLSCRPADRRPAISPPQARHRLP